MGAGFPQVIESMLDSAAIPVGRQQLMLPLWRSALTEETIFSIGAFPINAKVLPARLEHRA
jgi:hypothetical protein